jgi:ATP-dependent Clp protease ATP-binding subunit ClpC
MYDPKDIFKKFSEQTRHLLVSSQKIAETMKTGIGSEDILLALTVTSGSLAHKILKENMVNIDQIRLIIRFNNLKSVHGHGFSQEAKKILELAMDKAVRLKHSLVEPEHILWAIVTNKGCLAYKILSKIGIDLENIEEDLDDVLEENGEFDDFTEKNLDSLGTESQVFGFETPKDFMIFGSQPFSVSSKINTREKNKSKTPMLDYFGINLNNLAKNNKLDPVVGREKELERIVQILCRKTKNNPVLVGDPGIGKTAIAEGLAQKIVKGSVPTKLKNKKVISIDLALIVSGTMYRGQFEERIKKIVDEISQSGNIILFLDEIHTIIGSGSAEGSMDAANILKPALAKGQLRLIGATTKDEYRKHIEKDTALERRLQPVKVEEPSSEETVQILKGLRPKYEIFHDVKITDQAIKDAVYLSKRYIQDRYLPDKAIDLIDEAASALQIANQLKNKNKKLIELENKLHNVLALKETQAEKQNYEDAARLKTQEIQLKIEIDKLKIKLKPKAIANTVDSNEIAKVVSLWTNVPVSNMLKKDKIKILNLNNILKEKIIGQDEAISSVSTSIMRSKAGIGDPNRPIGAFIFLGPTGVGKTELARVLAEELFGSRDAIIKIDMSEFMEKHNVSRLVGAPPGYVGYDEAGKLTEAVRQKPYSLILFDEIEKAHPEVFNILLQILEDGQLTDAKGRTVNFRNCIIILTSNLGTHELSKTAALGFREKNEIAKKSIEKKYSEMKENITKQLKNSFKPELVNRLDKIIVFKPLAESSVLKITNLKLKELEQRLEIEHFKITFDDKTKNYLAKKSFDPEYGARPVRRTISDLVENPLSEAIISGKFVEGDSINVSLVKDKICFNKAKNI